MEHVHQLGIPKMPKCKVHIEEPVKAAIFIIYKLQKNTQQWQGHLIKHLTNTDKRASIKSTYKDFFEIAERPYIKIWVRLGDKREI